MIRLDLPIDKNDEDVLQSFANQLAMRLHTEEEIEAASDKAKTLRRRLKLTGWTTAAIGLTCELAAILHYSPDETGGLVAMLAAACAGLTMVVCIFWWSGADNRVKLFDFLAVDPNMCARVRQVASESASVTAYVREVTASGRQLRRFDVARVNALYAEERDRVDDQYAAESCAVLHSL